MNAKYDWVSLSTLANNSWPTFLIYENWLSGCTFVLALSPRRGVWKEALWERWLVEDSKEEKRRVNWEDKILVCCPDLNSRQSKSCCSSHSLTSPVKLPYIVRWCSYPVAPLQGLLRQHLHSSSFWSMPFLKIILMQSHIFFSNLFPKKIIFRGPPLLNVYTSCLVQLQHPQHSSSPLSPLQTSGIWIACSTVSFTSATHLYAL